MQGPISLVDANGQPLPPGAVGANGQFAEGFRPNTDVFARDASNNPLAVYDHTSNTWSAVNAQGQPTGVTMDPQTGNWTAGPSHQPVTFDPNVNNGNGAWYASNAGGNVVYDTNTNQFQTPAGAPINYDQNSQQYYAQNDSNIRYSPDQNSFVSTQNN